MIHNSWTLVKKIRKKRTKVLKFIITTHDIFYLFSLPFVSTISEILKVRLGEYDVSTTAEPLRHEEFNITDIVIYPGFNNSTLVHDIALLKLESPAKRKQVKDMWTLLINVVEEDSFGLISPEHRRGVHAQARRLHAQRGQEHAVTAAARNLLLLPLPAAATGPGQGPQVLRHRMGTQNRG